MTAVIEAVDLRYRYADGTEALRGVSFAVSEGECVGVVGPNGAGKSTLLLHLNGIIPDPLPQRGSSVRVGGRPMTKDNLYEIRREVGLLFQDPDDQLFCPTVLEDVAFGPKQFGLPHHEQEALVRASLAQVRLDGFEQRAPHHLSLGEKRRACLAGLLACQPRVLVLDEPTSNLDPRSRRELIALLETLPATRIIASHDLDFVYHLCGRVLVLDGGAIVAEGSCAEILGDEELMLAHGLERPLSMNAIREADQAG